MRVTKTRLIFDSDGNICEVIHPDWDEQLQDPVFSPSGFDVIDVPDQNYQGCASEYDVLTVAQAHTPGDKLALRKAIAARIKKRNDDIAAEETRQEQAAAEAAAAGEG